MHRPVRQLEVERTPRLHLFLHECDALFRDFHDPLRVVFHMGIPLGTVIDKSALPVLGRAVAGIIPHHLG